MTSLHLLLWIVSGIVLQVAIYCYVPPYSRLFVASYSGVRQEECPTL